MANDWILNMGVTGQEKLVGTLKDVTRELNEADKAADRQRRRLEAINTYRRRAGELARQERREAFQRLSAEEQLLRLQRQRERIQERMTRAHGNELRTAALRVRLAETEARIRQHAPPVISPGVPGGALSGMMGAMAGSLAQRLGGGMLGGFIGAAGGPIGIAAGSAIGLLLGGGIARAGGAAMRGIGSAFARADADSDLAEQLGVSRMDILRLRRAAGYAGVRETAAVRGMSRMGQMRAQALAGDTGAMALFRQYGVSESQLRTQSHMQIGQAIRASLGKAGALPTDEATLAQLLGDRWQQVLAVFTTMSGMGDGAVKASEESMKKLDEANQKIEAFTNRLKDFATTATAKLLDVAEKVFGNPRWIKAIAALFSWIPGVSTAATAATAAIGAAGNSIFGTAPAGNIPDQRTAGTGAASTATTPAEAITQISGGGRGIVHSADALARVGLFRGGDNTRSILEQYNRKLTIIISELQLLNHTVNKE